MTSMKYVNMQSRIVGRHWYCWWCENPGSILWYIWISTFSWGCIFHWCFVKLPEFRNSWYCYFLHLDAYFFLLSCKFSFFISPDYYPIFYHFHLTGWFARDPSVLRQVGNVLLQASSTEPRRTRRLIFADDCFQFYKVPKQKTVNVIRKAAESLSGCKATAPIFRRMGVFSGMRAYFRKKFSCFSFLFQWADQSPKNMNISEHISSNVPSLKEFKETLANAQKGIANLKALSSAMLLLQG